MDDGEIMPKATKQRQLITGRSVRNPLPSHSDNDSEEGDLDLTVEILAKAASATFPNNDGAEEGELVTTKTKAKRRRDTLLARKSPGELRRGAHQNDTPVAGNGAACESTNDDLEEGEVVIHVGQEASRDDSAGVDGGHGVACSEQGVEKQGQQAPRQIGEAPKKKKKKKPKKTKAPVDEPAVAIEQAEIQAPPFTPGMILADGTEVTSLGAGAGFRISSDAVPSAEEVLSMRQLLRGPRYFAPQDETDQRCYNCDEAGHLARDCVQEIRLKPCYVCGTLGHMGRDCPQSIQCFECGKSGHMARLCPERGFGRWGSGSAVMCIRCGCSGHEYSSCRHDYDPQDLLFVHCYICGKAGHLSCADLAEPPPDEVSCYNCGGAGHSGEDCVKPRGVAREGEENSSQLCFVCGEEGHFARSCTRTLSKGHRRRSSPLRQRQAVHDRWAFQDSDEGQSHPGSDMGKARRRSTGDRGAPRHGNRTAPDHHRFHRDYEEVSYPRGGGDGGSDDRRSPVKRRRGSGHFWPEEDGVEASPPRHQGHARSSHGSSKLRKRRHSELEYGENGGSAAHHRQDKEEVQEKKPKRGGGFWDDLHGGDDQSTHLARQKRHVKRGRHDHHQEHREAKHEEGRNFGREREQKRRRSRE